MRTGAESSLLAVVLPPTAAAEAVRAAWAEGDAVAIIDPRDPQFRVEERLAALRPTEILDATGRRAWRDRDGEGEPVPAGVAAVVGTSGTTAEPRWVMLDEHALEASAFSVHAALGADPIDDIWLACVPLTGVAGLAILARAFHTGTDVIVHDRFDTAAVARAPQEGATLVSLVPTTLGRLLDAGAPVDRFRHVLLGGAPAPPGLLARARAAGAHVSTTYGLTETGGGCVHDGRPLIGVEVVTDPVTDEILVRGQITMRGYRLDEPATAAAFTPDGFLRTGDLGRIDDAGRLRVGDRRKDVIITGGVNVSPTAVEHVLLLHPAIRDVCVVGLPDTEWGERVVAYVVPVRKGLPPSLADLRAFAQARLTSAELPREIRTVDEIPRSPGGKLLRRLLPR
jgi:O-succinylbenzoic acid--CoA ligase